MQKEKNMFILQPVLTVLLIVLIFFLLNGNNGLNINSNGSLRILQEEANFDEVVNNFFQKNYQVLTRGTIYTKTKKVDQNTGKEHSTLISNEYDDFFILEKGTLKRINSKTDQFDISMFYDLDGGVVILDHMQKKYLYYIHSQDVDGNSDADKLNKLIKHFFDNEIFPLIALVKDFKEKKFNPIKRSSNVFVGQWRHQSFTSNEVCEVIVALEPSNKTFKSIAFSNTIPPSTLYFDFREIENLSEILKIPEGYIRIDQD